MKAPDPGSGGKGQRDRAKSIGSRSGPPRPVRAKPGRNLTDSSHSSARAVADATVAGWSAVAQALVPILGQSSVTVLYRRCLISAGLEHTWLPSVAAADLPQNDWKVLHASVSRQTPEDASEACDSLFVSFRGLLGSLIGPSLTEQLLRPASAHPSTGSADQDTLP